MDFDEYQVRMKRIHDELADISKLTANQTLLGIANSSNPNFVALMKKHQQLTTLSSQLTEWMLNELNGEDDTESKNT